MTTNNSTDEPVDEFLEAWMRFCDGDDSVDDSHLELVLMGDKAKDRVKTVLGFVRSRKLTKYVLEHLHPSVPPAKLSVAEKRDAIMELTALDTREKLKVIRLVLEDLVQVKTDRYSEYLINDHVDRLHQLISILEKGVVKFTWNLTAFAEYQKYGSLDPTYYEDVLAYASKKLYPKDRVKRKVSRVLWGLSRNYNLTTSLMSPLFRNSEINFDYYRQIYKLGGQYMIVDDGYILAAPQVEYTVKRHGQSAVDAVKALPDPVSDEYIALKQREANYRPLDKLRLRCRDAYILSDVCLTGGLPGDKICIEELTDGTWRVYFSEMGDREDITIFESEQEACDYLFDWAKFGKTKAMEILKKNGS